jgi:hypothetical protein
MTVRITKPEINIREKLAELDKPSGIAGEAMLRAETPQEQFNMISAGRRNLLINGDFKVSQRGTYTSATTSPNTYCLDRWEACHNGTATIQHTSGIDIEGTPAICKGVKLVQTVTGSNYLGIRQKIENPTQYVGRTLTYSAWVRSNTTNARIEWYTQGTTQEAIGPSHSGNGEWEYLSYTTVMTGNPSTNWYVDVFIDNGAYGNTTITAGDYFECTMLQLEIGNVATPFEHRSYGEELALCQRYTYVIDGPTAGDRVGDGFSYSTTGVIATIPFPVKMRAKPTLEGTPSQVTFNDSIAGTNSSAISLNGCNTHFGSLNVTVSATAFHGGQVYFSNTADNKIIFKAEL